MQLKDTIELMTSDNWEDRFVAEYWQTKNRYEYLKNIANRYEVAIMKNDFENILGFRPNCPLETYREQQRCMGLYLHQLELRAIMENVNLSGPPCSGTQF